ncbi:hypothetical protein EAI06_07620 [Limosilactobacillus reuteri]|nr:hypothetical protein EAI06_07620 [Limosilactobacillus reuteri]
MKGKIMEIKKHFKLYKDGKNGVVQQSQLLL